MSETPNKNSLLVPPKPDDFSFAAEALLTEFEEKWGGDYPAIVQSWRINWVRIIPFFDYPPEIRRIIYTTNAIESVNMSLRKITKNRGSFPSDEVLLKLFYLALTNISRKWTMPFQNWKSALNRLPSFSTIGCQTVNLNSVYTKFRTPSREQHGYHAKPDDPER